MSEKFDIMSAVTDRILEVLKNGTAPWVQPWVGNGGCIKHKSGGQYSLINQLMLGKEGEYLSFKEAEAEGGHVKKGAKGKMVVFWKMYQSVDKDTLDEKGQPMIKTIPYLRYYTVFHIDDCEGITPKWTDKKFETRTIDNAQAVLDEYKTRCKVGTLNEDKNRAFYRPSTHEINLPDITQFKDSAEYYSTAFHEAVHSTGHYTLLDRFPKDAMLAAFGSESYSREELVAEIGA